jgi:nucleoside-diphosphate kinase
MKGMEWTLVLIKPDAVKRGLIGELIGRIERKGLRIAAMKMLHLDRALAERLYEVHKGKPFFDELIRFITSSPLVAMVVVGRESIKVVRSLMGATNPLEALPGTIRGDWGFDLTANLIHGSDSPQSAAKEISIFFTDEEILQ